MANIRRCLERVGRSPNIDALRLSAHSRGGCGLAKTMASAGLITGPIDRITFLDCGEFFSAATVAGFKARGAGVVHYRVNNKNAVIGADVRNLPSECMRAIGYCRLIDDAREVRPGIAVPSPVAAQLLPLPPRSSFSSRATPPSGKTPIGDFCKTNSAAVGRILKQENDTRSGLLEFMLGEGLLRGLRRFPPGIYSHHLFVSEIAHELVD